MLLTSFSPIYVVYLKIPFFIISIQLVYQSSKLNMKLTYCCLLLLPKFYQVLHIYVYIERPVKRTEPSHISHIIAWVIKIENSYNFTATVIATKEILFCVRGPSMAQLFFIFLTLISMTTSHAMTLQTLLSRE